MAAMTQMNRYNRYSDNGVVDLFVGKLKRHITMQKTREPPELLFNQITI